MPARSRGSSGPGRPGRRRTPGTTGPGCGPRPGWRQRRRCRPGMAQVRGHVPQGRGHDAPSLGQRGLNAVEQFGDHVLLKPGQDHPAAAIPQAGFGAAAEDSEFRPAGEPPGPVVRPAQAGLRAGSQALAGCHRAGSKGRARDGRRMFAVAADVSLNALAAPASQPVAAQAQITGPDGPLEAGDPADQAPPVTRTVLPAEAGLAEGPGVGSAARTKAITASGAQTARVPRLQLAAGDPADRVAEQRMLPVRRQGLRRRIPAGQDEQRVVDRPGEPVPAQVPRRARCRLAQRPHGVASPKPRGPRRSTAAR